jgi:hypothetical protein
MTFKTHTLDDGTSRIYHRSMTSLPWSVRRQFQPLPFCIVGAVLPLPLIKSPIPFRLWSGLAGVSSVILQVFRNEDRISTWLAIGLMWLACAAAALASAYLVYRVAETRKRLFNE